MQKAGTQRRLVHDWPKRLAGARIGLRQAARVLCAAVCKLALLVATLPLVLESSVSAETQTASVRTVEEFVAGNPYEALRRSTLAVSLVRDAVLRDTVTPFFRSAGQRPACSRAQGHRLHNGLLAPLRN